METLVISNTATMKEFFKTLDKKDLVAATGFWAADHQMHCPSTGPGMNRDMHKGMSQMFMTGFPDYIHVIEDIFETGYKVMTRGYFTGTHKGSFMNIPATGRSVKVSWIDISEFDNDGKV